MCYISEVNSHFDTKKDKVENFFDADIEIVTEPNKKNLNIVKNCLISSKFRISDNREISSL